MKKTFLLIAFAVLFPLALSADGGEKYALKPSAFGDNWFLQVGGGVNTVFNNGIGRVSPAAEFYVGKWFFPSFGVRVGALGYRNRPNGTETGWFSGREPFWFGHADVDVMTSVINWFNYNEHRFWDICPYLRGSAIYTSQGEGGHVEPGVGVGIHNGLRLGKRVDLYLEATAVAAREKAYRERGNVILFPSATAGIVVKLGRVGWRRHEPVYVKGDTEYVERVVRDTVTVVEIQEKEKIVVDSVLIKQMKEEPLTLFFDLDQTVLTQREVDHLEFYAKYVLTPDSVVLLTGSADKETGNPSHNQWLSEQRNAYVKDILIRVYKLKPENIQEVANGDRKNEFRTKEMNRCVTISFIK